MVKLYYYGHPHPFLSTAPLQPDQSLNYWFGYPNQEILEALRKEPAKQEKGKDKEKKEDKKDEKKEDKKDEKKEENKKKDDKKPKLIELKVPLCCESCARRVKKKLERMNGVEKPVICDMYDMKVSVTATAKPEDVLKKVKEVKKDADMWPQKKK